MSFYVYSALGDLVVGFSAYPKHWFVTGRKTATTEKMRQVVMIMFRVKILATYSVFSNEYIIAFL